MTCTLPPLVERQNAQPSPCGVQIPLVTKKVLLDYKDMLTPRKKKDQNQKGIDKRKKEVDALFRSMCLGILQFGNEATETIVLTYDPTVRPKNYRIACGQVSCGDGEQCDEFPFASTQEGGVAPGICIPARGNSIQGGFLGSQLKSNNIKPGEKFILRFDGINCKEFLGTGSSGAKAPLPRALANESSLEIGLTEQLQNLTVDGFGPFNPDDNVLDHGLYPISDLGPGTYAVSTTVNTGIVRSFSIIDNQGTEYASITRNLNNSSGVVSLTFNLTERAVITLMVDVTIGDDIDIRASLQQVTSSNATTSPTSTFHSNPTAISGEKGGPVTVLKGYIFSLWLVLLGFIM
ncbi:hypothetical protein M422DRAFT_261561 [Sphaerobolus stellatus SS14]|uniref:Deoxyribonuclease NucA/NucB domain-containing protein n=1 Tax=Sphaerobolus stellatus (strain SS14) TaxID=990650 RepID=A0A0C9V2U7_SPHS4|nr:hypothetical protein M422DRAFT_261561 [Sphaerobolus stellatus SS14]